MTTPKHCDEYIDDPNQPECLREFLAFKRMPAYDQYMSGKTAPPLYALYKQDRVRVVMASRFGDVGITTDLTAERGYEKRVAVEQLSGFSKEP